MYHSHFTTINKKETPMLEILDFLQKVEENTHERILETLEFKNTKPN